MVSENPESPVVRITNFDFLRGFFVLLALSQHYGAYLNEWYFWRSTPPADAAVLAQFSGQFAGTRLSLDSLGVALAWFFSPWVSHIYLALAAFNLAKRSEDAFKAVYKSKLLIFASLFFFFFLENAIVTQSPGELLSFYPLMTWMVVLSLLTLLYRFIGINGVVVAYIVSLLHPLTGIDSAFDSFELYVQSQYLTHFEYDARIHFFLPSGCLGFILGYLHFQKNAFKQTAAQMYGLCIAILLYALWYIFGESFQILATDMFHYEHMFDRSMTGMFFVQGVQLFVLLLFLGLHIRSIYIPRNLFHWIGVWSLLVFGLHRILFLKLLGPLREVGGALFAIPMSAGTVEVFTLCFCSVALTALIAKLPIWPLFTKSNTKNN